VLTPSPKACPIKFVDAISVVYFGSTNCPFHFFKTSIKGRRIIKIRGGEKYVLEINAAYVGDKPEIELAEKLEKPLALIASQAIGKLSLVDDWWFNYDFDKLVRKLPIPKLYKDVPSLVRNLTGKERSEKPQISFDYEGNKFELAIGMDMKSYLRPKNGKYGTEYLQTRGTYLAGGAWRTWDKDGKNIPPTPESPSLILSVSLPGHKYTKLPIVDEREMKIVQDARDYLADIIRP